MLTNNAQHSPGTIYPTQQDSGANRIESGQGTFNGRHCTRSRRLLNTLILKTRGPVAALRQAAKTNDVDLINTLLGPDSSYPSLSPDVRSGKKMLTPATKAAVHGKTAALNALLKYGADSNQAMAVHNWRSPILLKCGDFYRNNAYIPTVYCTPETLEILLAQERTDPNQLLQMRDYLLTDLTQLEVLVSASRSKHTDRLCKILINNRNFNLNTAISFYPERLRERRPEVYKNLPAIPENLSPRVNVISLALLLNRPDIVELLLECDRLNPGLPEGSAENLISIFMYKLSHGYFHNFISPLRQKIKASVQFREQLLTTDNIQRKRDLIKLFEIDIHSTDYPDCNLYPRNDLNPKIRELFADAPPAYESLMQQPANH